MGYSDVRGVLAEGMSMKEEVKQANLNESIHEVQAIAREWYRQGRHITETLQDAKLWKKTKVEPVLKVGGR
jgi:hypothetical protein